MGEVLERHLPYEINMLQRSLECLERGLWKAKGDEYDEVLKNSLLESCCIHARALVEFLESKPKKKDDLTAKSFVKEFSATHVKAPEVKGTIIGINKKIMHVTELKSKNIPDKINVIDLQRLLVAILKDLEEFRIALPDEFHSRWKLSKFRIVCKDPKALTSDDATTAITPISVIYTRID